MKLLVYSSVVPSTEIPRISTISGDPSGPRLSADAGGGVCAAISPTNASKNRNMVRALGLMKGLFRRNAAITCSTGADERLPGTTGFHSDGSITLP